VSNIILCYSWYHLGNKGIVGLKQPEEEGETVSAAHPLLSYEDEMSQDTNDVPVMHVAEMASNQMPAAQKLTTAASNVTEQNIASSPL
jgi:hypothetical protein